MVAPMYKFSKADIVNFNTVHHWNMVCYNAANNEKFRTDSLPLIKKHTPTADLFIYVHFSNGEVILLCKKCFIEFIENTEGKYNMFEGDFRVPAEP